jgi:hypothetical protein
MLLDGLAKNIGQKRDTSIKKKSPIKCIPQQKIISENNIKQLIKHSNRPVIIL